MKQVMQTFIQKENKKRMNTIRLELDYELATLYEAMVEKNEAKKKECKKKLEKLRLEMLKLS